VDVFEECGMRSMAEYIQVRCQTIAQYVVNKTDLGGLRWRQTAERVDAASVVVGATNVLGRGRYNWI
jgi:hypothetical protein